jgi:hypothetical protein
MERDGGGNPASTFIADAEESADRLAYELLAPARHVLNGPALASRQALSDRLRQFYGLPSAQASRYARILLPPGYTDPLLARLKSMA